MGAEGWAKVLAGLEKCPARLCFAIFLIGATILAFPEPYATKLGLAPIVTPIKGWVTIGTIAAFAIWVAQLVPAFRKWRSGRKLRAEILEHLDSLSPEEFQILAYCVNRNRRTLLAVLNSKPQNILTGLCAKGLFLPMRGTQSMLAMPYTIPPFVWKKLTSMPDFVIQENKRAAAAQLFEDLDRMTSGRFDSILDVPRSRDSAMG